MRSGTKTTAPNQLWQTDFTYLKVTGWGWYYLSTVLDDFSRFIAAWKLCATMQASDVTDTLDLALAASGLDQISVAPRPRLLSDNGASYIAGDLAEWLDGKGMAHVRGAPRHPQTQGKIERWHQTLKNRILLEQDYLPGDLEAQVGALWSTTIAHQNAHLAMFLRRIGFAVQGPVPRGALDGALPLGRARGQQNCQGWRG